MIGLAHRTPEGAYTALDPVIEREPPRQLRVMSYNIQSGLETRRYHHYVTRGWQHFWPSSSREGNLDRMGHMLHQYDLVGLQEVDAGSFRTGYVNQVEYLARRGTFPYWYYQTNRNLGRLAQHSNGLLTRYRPASIDEHALPGRVPGRGALHLRFGGAGEALNVIIVHLALSRRARATQLAYLADLINEHRHVIVMGDFNCHSRSPEFTTLVDRTELLEPVHDLHTFPSWKPQRNIDHILLSSSLEVGHVRVLDYPLSDHLPITMDISLPEGIELVG
ncbi:endonuclease/exonuclease/phosphatase family protein [Alkalilimnicola ehrlichii MLHE-1]|uniref:Endonuclease/exonuclease/phosphatase n=1 Tax=Alkalilimnicola ehrlichii (strain ATCC BAA-1101 / DSM 17681 / MLHE-1) TaxID=187272 RepID=Q0A4P8_ALKEH|nr:endonuclease/exonuclease/phosphatase family protein [Alkalilimnicola ehrlichii]ABI58189.1 Endonuclease/exonuclease/phosphatase [Alkalilimnicola ehrlichii MLHE-1]